MLFTHIHTEEIGTNIFFEKRVLFENAPRSAPDRNTSALTTKEVQTLKGKEEITIAKEQKELRSVLLLKMMTAEVTQELIDAEEKYEEDLQELKDKKKEYLRELDEKTFKISSLDKDSLDNVFKAIKEGENLVSTPSISIGSPDYMKELGRSNMEKNDIKNNILRTQANKDGKMIISDILKEHIEYDKKYNALVELLGKTLEDKQKSIITKLVNKIKIENIDNTNKNFLTKDFIPLLLEETNAYVKELHTLERSKKNVEKKILSKEEDRESISTLIEYLENEGGQSEKERVEIDNRSNKNEKDLEKLEQTLEKTEQEIKDLKSKYGRD